MSATRVKPGLPVVIIGAGLAGLTVALHLADERPVILLAKRNLDEAATAWAQGGIVGVLGSDDSIESHVRDTQDAGAGLVDENTARFIAEHSARAVEWLVERGVPFSPDPEGPLCLYHPRERSFLITEAMRGEGGLLKLPSSGPGDPGGTRFMPAHDERAELAPRDIVARAIDFEMKKHGLDYVHLDATHLGETFLKEHFPTIYARCFELGIDIAKQPIPVVPAAHYTCGGVVSDLLGRSDLPGL